VFSASQGHNIIAYGNIYGHQICYSDLLEPLLADSGLFRRRTSWCYHSLQQWAKAIWVFLQQLLLDSTLACGHKDQSRFSLSNGIYRHGLNNATDNLPQVIVYCAHNIPGPRRRPVSLLSLECVWNYWIDFPPATANFMVQQTANTGPCFTWILLRILESASVALLCENWAVHIVTTLPQKD